MGSDQIARSIYYALALLLVASALAARRLPRGKLLSLAAIWAAIIAALWALVDTILRLR